MYTPPSTDLLKPGTIQDFCDAYAQAVQMADKAYADLATAHERMTRIIERFEILPGHMSDYDLRDGATQARAKSAALMQRSAWRELLRMTGVLDVMTRKKRDEAYKNIEDGNVPPVTYENVLGLLNGLRGDVGRIVDESIAEASRILRPRESGYKTNGDGWQLGRRAIVAYGISWDKHCGFGLNYHRDGDIHAVDNAFHLLDGKGVPAHPNRLADAIRLAMRDGRQNCETDYYRCKWFKTGGSLHMEFKRMDLVDELNRRTADHRSLRQSA